MSLLVPLYVHPAADPAAWRAAAGAARLLHGVVLNAADGPGAAPEPGYAAAAKLLRSAGVRVYGYVDTAYGRRPDREVLADVRRHRDWYGARAVFYDQAAADPGLLRRYRRLVRAARGCGMRAVALNPGTHPDPGYAVLADLVVTFEGPFAAYRTASVPRWTAEHPPERFCHLVHQVPAGLAHLVGRLAAARGARVHCAVGLSGANPWRGVPAALREGQPPRDGWPPRGPAPGS
ncbi:spherulation-specific family 4 protein [Streptomyces capparidis]